MKLISPFKPLLLAIAYASFCVNFPITKSFASPNLPLPKTPNAVPKIPTVKANENSQELPPKPKGIKLPDLSINSDRPLFAILDAASKIQPRSSKQKAAFSVLLRNIRDIGENPTLETDKEFIAKFKSNTIELQQAFPNSQLTILTYFNLLGMEFIISDYGAFYADVKDLIEISAVFAKKNSALGKVYLARAYTSRGFASLVIGATKSDFKIPALYGELKNEAPWVIAKADTRNALRVFGKPETNDDRNFATIYSWDKAVDVWAQSFIDKPNIEDTNQRIDKIVGYDPKRHGKSVDNTTCPPGTTIGFDNSVMENAGNEVSWGVSYIVLDLVDSDKLENISIITSLPNNKFRAYVEAGIKNAKPKIPNNASAKCRKNFVALILFATQPIIPKAKKKN